MNELIKITDDAVNARDLWAFLEVNHHFRDWIRNAIRDYSFIEGKDFSYFFSKSKGGRPSKDYAITVDMAKELSMVSRTKRGKQARDYFIKCEKIAKEAYINSKAIRLSSIETRKTLTDKVKDSGENERMHGHAYSVYTKLAYKLCDIEYKKQKDFRSSLDRSQLSRVETVEKMIDSLLSMGKQYNEIKESLNGLISFKALENNKE